MEGERLGVRGDGDPSHTRNGDRRRGFLFARNGARGGDDSRTCRESGDLTGGRVYLCHAWRTTRPGDGGGYADGVNVCGKRCFFPFA